MSRPTMMPIDQTQVHPRHEELFGKIGDKDEARLVASIQSRGVIEPVIVTPPNAADHPLCAVNGNERLRIAKALGITEVPVIVDPSLLTEALQLDAMHTYTQRKDFTWSQRAKQAKALRTMLAVLPPAEWRRRGWDGLTATDVVSMVIRQPERQVYRIEAVFGNETSTDALKRAVDQGKLPLYEAEGIVKEAERRRVPGSRNAQRLVDHLLERKLRDRENGKRPKHTRAPRTPVFDPTPKKASFLTDVQRQLLDWAVSEMPASTRSSFARSALVNDAVKSFMVDVRAAASALRVRLRRLSVSLSGRVKAVDGPNSLSDTNDALAVLGLSAVRRLGEVDLVEVRRTHRVLARAYHPDLNDAPNAREKFERIHGAYERVLELCDAR